MIVTTSEGGGKGPGYREFLITSPLDVSDLQNIEADPGSIAITQDLGHAYMLAPDGTWQEV